MTLEEYIGSLRGPARFYYAIKLVRLAMPMWEAYAAQKETIDYIGSAVGTPYSFDAKLLQKTVDGVEQYVNSPGFHDGKFDAEKFNTLKEEWWAPIRGLEWEEDWYIPDDLKLLVYAVHNLLDAAMGLDQTRFGESTVYVSINQSIDALTSSKRMTMEQIRGVIGL